MERSSHRTQCWVEVTTMSEQAYPHRDPHYDEGREGSLGLCRRLRSDSTSVHICPLTCDPFPAPGGPKRIMTVFRAAASASKSTSCTRTASECRVGRRSAVSRRRAAAGRIMAGWLREARAAEEMDMPTRACGTSVASSIAASAMPRESEGERVRGGGDFGREKKER
eukprot:scaffold131185_cov27-Tisochrysis_lutea.AAC.3